MQVKRLLLLLILCCPLVIVLGACGTGRASTSSASGPTIHMNSADFERAEITIHTGQSVTLINDDLLTPHIIANGMWENDKAKPDDAPNAPQANHVQINGHAQATIGPFTTAGTFKYYCPIHPGMNLTVTVQ